MFYIYGNKSDRENFIKNNPIPFFRWQNQLDDVLELHDDDETAALYIDATENTYTLQVRDAETGAIVSETEYGTYTDALNAYNATA